MNAQIQQAQRDRAVALCRAGKTVTEAARAVGAGWNAVRRWCDIAGIVPVKGKIGRPRAARGECIRCGDPAPGGERHCGWECYFEDVYDQAGADARAEGLSEDAFRQRRGALYLERSALKSDELLDGASP